MICSLDSSCCTLNHTPSTPYGTFCRVHSSSARLGSKCYSNTGEGPNSTLLWWMLPTATIGIFRVQIQQVWLGKPLFTELKSSFGIRDMVACIIYLLPVFIIRNYETATLVLSPCQKTTLCGVFYLQDIPISQILYRHFRSMVSSPLHNKNARRQTLKENNKRKEHAWRQLAKIKNRAMPTASRRCRSFLWEIVNLKHSGITLHVLQQTGVVLGLLAIWKQENI